jgi:hypothetical protein
MIGHSLENPSAVEMRIADGLLEGSVAAHFSAFLVRAEGGFWQET